MLMNEPVARNAAVSIGGVPAAVPAAVPTDHPFMRKVLRTESATIPAETWVLMDFTSIPSVSARSRSRMEAAMLQTKPAKINVAVVMMIRTTAPGVFGIPSSANEVATPSMLPMAPLNVVAKSRPILPKTFKLKSIPTDIMPPPSNNLGKTGRFARVASIKPSGINTGARAKVSPHTMKKAIV